MNPDKLKIQIHVHAPSVKERGQLALDLRSSLPDVETELVRERPDSMDLGTVLVAVLGAESIVLLARGLAKWLGRTGAVVDIHADGRVTARNVSGHDVAQIVSAMKADEAAEQPDDE